MVEYVCEGPDGYRPKMLQVPVRDAIRTGAGGGFCEVHCGFGHVGCDRGWGVGVWFHDVTSSRNASTSRLTDTSEVLIKFA